MPHTGKYTKGEKRELKMKGVIPGTKKAHKVVSKGKAGGLSIIKGKYES